MAAPNQFPSRKAMGAGGMTAGQGAGSEPLDGPPPSPVMANAPQQLQPGAAAQQPMPSFSQMAQPMTAGSPGRAVAPESVVGMMQTAETIYGILDSFASMVPDLANDFALQKDLLQRSMAKLLTSSGSIGNTGSPGMGTFPGGGFASNPAA